MSYGLRYLREYTNRADADCRLEFWQKDYAGTSQYILGSRDSFVLAKEIDDPFEPIQAQPATIELLTDEQTGFSIDEFYSEDDEEWLIKFYMIPFGGIQRDVFYTADVFYIYFIHTTSDNYILVDNPNDSIGIKTGQTIEINAITYTITSADYVNGQYVLHIAETLQNRTIFDTRTTITVYDVIEDGLIYTGFILQDETSDSFISYDHLIKLTVTDNLGILSDISFDAACKTANVDPYQPFTIAEYLKIILAQTGLQLPIQVYANIYELSMTKRSDDATATFADQTRLYSGAFADDGGTWQSCYDVLNTILQAFGCIICQRKGKWVIYRWGELRALNNTAFAGTEFSADLTSKSAVSLSNQPVVITEKRNVLTGGAENVMYHTRPYKYVKETFNYNQPAQLIKNLDLQQLGTLRATSTVVRDGETITIRDYDAPLWFLDPVEAGIATNHYIIRVETDSNNVEVTRYLVTTTNLGAKIDYVTVTNGAYVNKGDKININLSMRAPGDPGSNFYDYYISIYDGHNRYWLSRGNSAYQDGSWNKNIQTGIRTDFNPPATDYKDWHSWGVDSLQIPVDGWMNIRLGIQDANGGETHWKDITLQYQPFINESTQITGQTHTQTQTGIIKNHIESERKADDSPRNLIAGTLFTNDLTSFSLGNANFWYPNPTSAYITKTKAWMQQVGEQKKLGQITTADRKQVYSKLRHRLDCSIYFDDYIDLLSTIQIAALGGLNFRFAAISSINFADCTCKAVLIELWGSGEGLNTYDYKFDYLYKKA